MKFMLLQEYGGVENEAVGPMSTWTAEEIEAHIAYQLKLNEELSERGELVEAQALTAPEQAKFVVHDGSGAPVITDGPFPEGKELLAGTGWSTSSRSSGRLRSLPRGRLPQDPAVSRSSSGSRSAR